MVNYKDLFTTMKENVYLNFSVVFKIGDWNKSNLTLKRLDLIMVALRVHSIKGRSWDNNFETIKNNYNLFDNVCSYRTQDGRVDL